MGKKKDKSQPKLQSLDDNLWNRIKSDKEKGFRIIGNTNLLNKTVENLKDTIESQKITTEYISCRLPGELREEFVEYYIRTMGRRYRRDEISINEMSINTLMSYINGWTNYNNHFSVNTRIPTAHMWVMTGFICLEKPTSMNHEISIMNNGIGRSQINVNKIYNSNNRMFAIQPYIFKECDSFEMKYMNMKNPIYAFPIMYHIAPSCHIGTIPTHTSNSMQHYHKYTKKESTDPKIIQLQNVIKQITKRKEKKPIFIHKKEVKARLKLFCKCGADYTGYPETIICEYCGLVLNQKS